MRPLIAGNWKMHGLAPQLGEIDAIAASVRASPPFADILICLPATLIARAVQTADGGIAIGGEDCSTEIAGAFTGDISAEMLKDAGASAVIVGHSERRQHHGETDAIVAAKARAARRAGLLAIICIGETKSQRLDGKALSVCGDQIAGSVPEGMTSSAIAIGYEPLWAIGTGHTPTSEEIAEMHAPHPPVPCRAFGHGRERGAHPLRRVGQTVQRARDPGAAGSWRRAGRWRKPEGCGFRSNFQGCVGESLTTRNDEITAPRACRSWRPCGNPMPGVVSLADVRKSRRQEGRCLMTATHSDALVIFGVTGDLAHKMIFPALYAMAKRGSPDCPRSWRRPPEMECGAPARTGGRQHKAIGRDR